MKLGMKLLVAGAVLAVCFTADAKKMYLINFDKGGMPNDSANCEFALSEEHAPKGQIYLKVTTKTPTANDYYWCGEFGPKKANWDGYDVVKFDYFNESKSPVSSAFSIRPKGSTYATRLDASFVMRPGKGSVEIEIAGACSNSGTPLDFKIPLIQWGLTGQGSVVFHIGNITLETNEDEKDSKKEDKKDDKKK